MSNLEIYNIALEINKAFGEDLILPVKANFYIMKNKNKFLELGQQIETMKFQILNKYGELDQETQDFTIPQENAEKVNQEISDLFSLEQEVDFYTISLEDLGNGLISSKAISILEFMIKEE